MQDQPRLLDDLRNSIVPVVALWQGTTPLEFPTVDVDDRAGILAGLEHVVGLGHERIAFVSAHLPGDNRPRSDAFVEFMNERFGGVAARLRPGRPEHPGRRRGGAPRAARPAPSRRPPWSPRRTSWRSASSTRRTALARTIPDELSVVGFDDILIAAHTVPALTTLRMPIAEIVGAGVELAIELARDPSASREPRITVYEPTLVVRQSTAPPPRRRDVRPHGAGRVSRRRSGAGGPPGSRRASPRRLGSPRRSRGSLPSSTGSIGRSPPPPPRRPPDREPRADRRVGDVVARHLARPARPGPPRSPRARRRPAGRPSRRSRRAGPRSRATAAADRRRSVGSGSVTAGRHVELEDDHVAGLPDRVARRPPRLARVDRLAATSSPRRTSSAAARHHSGTRRSSVHGASGRLRDRHGTPTRPTDSRSRPPRRTGPAPTRPRSSPWRTGGPGCPSRRSSRGTAATMRACA